MPSAGARSSTAQEEVPAAMARGPYAKSEHVQERIVQAAVGVFATAGFRASTLKEIAQRAGVSERGLVYHFRTKEALLEAVMNDHHERRSSVVLPASGLASFAAVLAVVDADVRLPDVVGLQAILSGEATADDHPAHDHYRLRYTHLRTYLSRAFATALDDGSATSELPADDLAAGLIALLDGLQMQWLFDRGNVHVITIAEGYLAAILFPEAMAQVRHLRREYVNSSLYIEPNIV